MPQSSSEISSVFLAQKIDEKLFSYIEKISFIPNNILTLNVAGSFIAKLTNLFPQSEIKKINIDELKSAHFSDADESVDLIVANATIIIDLDLNRFFLDARRILKKKGLFIFSTYDSSSRLMIEKSIEKTKKQLILDEKQVKKDLDKLYSLSYSSHEEQIRLSEGQLSVNIDIFTVAHVDVPQEVHLLKRVNIEVAEREEIKNQENQETSENEEKKKKEIEPEIEETDQEEEGERKDKDKPEKKEEAENREIQDEKNEKDIPEKTENVEEKERIEEVLERKNENIDGLEKEENIEENERVEENEIENKEEGQESVEVYENKEMSKEKEEPEEEEEGEKKEEEGNEREKDEEDAEPEEDEPEEFAHLENEMDKSKDRLTEYAEKLAQHLDSSAKLEKFLSGPQLNIKEKEKKLAELQARNIEHKKMLETYQNLHTQHRSLLNTLILSQEKLLKSNPNLRDQYHKLVANHGALLDKHNENIEEHQLFLKPRPFNIDT